MLQSPDFLEGIAMRHFDWMSGPLQQLLGSLVVVVDLGELLCLNTLLKLRSVCLCISIEKDEALGGALYPREY